MARHGKERKKTVAQRKAKQAAKISGRSGDIGDRGGGRVLPKAEKARQQQ